MSSFRARPNQVAMTRAVHYLLLLTIFDALVCLNASSWQVIWDSSLRQPYTPYDQSFSGSSILFHELQEHAGARVSENFVPLTELLPHIPAESKCVLILGVTIDSASWQKSGVVGAIQKFIRSNPQNHGVLIIVEHDNMFGNAERANELLRPRNVSVDYGTNFDFEHHDFDDPLSMWLKVSASKDIFDGMANLRVYLSPRIDIIDERSSKEGILHILNESAGVMIRRTESEGPIAVLGDCEIIWNMGTMHGVREGNNMRFMVQLLRHLAGVNSASQEDKSTCSAAAAAGECEREYGGAADKLPYCWNVPAQKRSDGRKFRILFSGAGGALLPDGGFSSSGVSLLASKFAAAGHDVLLSRSSPSSCQVPPASSGSDDEESILFDLTVVAAPLNVIDDESSRAMLAKTRRVWIISPGTSNPLSESELRSAMSDMGCFTPSDMDLCSAAAAANRIAHLVGAHFHPHTLIGPYDSRDVLSSPLSVNVHWKRKSTVSTFWRSGSISPLRDVPRDEICDDDVDDVDLETAFSPLAMSIESYTMRTMLPKQDFSNLKIPWKARQRGSRPEHVPVVALSGHCAFLSAELASITDSMIERDDSSGKVEFDAVSAWLEKSENDGTCTHPLQQSN